MLDVSKKLDRQSKDLLIAVHEAMSRLGAKYLVVGAFARDVVLAYGHGIDTGAATLDIDFAVMLENWDRFQALRTHLLGEALASAVSTALPTDCDFETTAPST